MDDGGVPHEIVIAVLRANGVDVSETMEDGQLKTTMIRDFVVEAQFLPVMVPRRFVLRLAHKFAVPPHYFWHPEMMAEEKLRSQRYNIPGYTRDQWHAISEQLHTQKMLSKTVQANIIRDVLGNPFRLYDKRCRLLPLQPEQYDTNPRVDWLTPTVLALTKAAYEEQTRRKCEKCCGKGRLYSSRVCDGCSQDGGKTHGDGYINNGTLDSDRLAILADALDDFGCRDEEVLSHLRSSSPHFRGCWILDLLLGKE